MRAHASPRSWMSRYSPPFLAALALPLAAPPAAAQATIVALTRGLGSLESTTEVIRRPKGTTARESALVGMRLGVTDELEGVSGSIDVKLRCGPGSDVLLSGTFRAMILAADAAQACQVLLLSGTADLMSSTPSRVSDGEVSAGAHKTQYAFTVRREGETVLREVRVFEGLVAVTRADRVDSLRDGTALALRGLQVAGRGLRPDVIQETADRYARVDLTSAGIPQGRAADLLPRLRDQHHNVLSRPLDPTLRLELAMLQIEHRVPSQGVLYQLDRAGGDSMGPGSTVQRRATIALLKGASYQNLGDTASADTHYRRADSLDRATTSQLIERYGIDRERILRIQRPGGATGLTPATPVTGSMTVSVEPIRQPGSDSVTFVVTVRDARGAPMSEAQVNITLATGTFLTTGASSVTGVTAADGTWRALWRCAGCIRPGPAVVSPARFDYKVTASRAGFATVTTSGTVPP